jgi:UDP-N-acetylglucosamine--N-acetylmuramyl-(pentapeptide) pyrophosphoryl-undecaprenol N-acetylglucosamine transferase
MPDAAEMTPERRAGPRLRVCLAGSGGGHIWQLLDLEPAWGSHDVFFVSEDTALSRSIAEKRPTHSVPHFALGQCGSVRRSR